MTQPSREELLRIVHHHIESALRWHEVFDDGRGGNDLTLQQTADLITERLVAALPGSAQALPPNDAARRALEFIVSVQEPFLSSTAYLMWNKARITLAALPPSNHSLEQDRTSRLQNQSGINQSLSEGTSREGAALPASSGEVREALRWIADQRDVPAVRVSDICTVADRALKSSPSVAPEGWKLVPMIPDARMIEVGCDNNPTSWNEGTDDGFAADVANDVYVSMVRAAPAPSVAVQPVDEMPPDAEHPVNYRKAFARTTVSSTNSTSEGGGKWNEKNRKCSKCGKDPILPEPCSNVDCPYVYS